MRAVCLAGFIIFSPVYALAQSPSFSPVGYPEHCMRKAAAVETVTLEFTLKRTGRPGRIEVVESTNRCFNRASVLHVRDWVYRLPATAHQQNRAHRTRAMLTFDKELMAPSKLGQIRPRIRQDLESVAQLLDDGGDGVEALNLLRDISNRYGALVASETAAHAILTAVALQEQGDLDTALAVLRQTHKERRKLGLSRRTQSLLAETIDDLEHLIALR